MTADTTGGAYPNGHAGPSVEEARTDSEVAAAWPPALLDALDALEHLAADYASGGKAYGNTHVVPSMLVAAERRVVEAVEAARRYSPTGDNHHNAADCPYCSERRQEQLDENRALFVRAEAAEGREGALLAAARQVDALPWVDLVRDWAGEDDDNFNRAMHAFSALRLAIEGRAALSESCAECGNDEDEHPLPWLASLNGPPTITFIDEDGRRWHHYVRPKVSAESAAVAGESADQARKVVHETVRAGAPPHLTQAEQYLNDEWAGEMRAAVSTILRDPDASDVSLCDTLVDLIADELRDFARAGAPQPEEAHGPLLDAVEDRRVRMVLGPLDGIIRHELRHPRDPIGALKVASIAVRTLLGLPALEWSTGEEEAPQPAPIVASLRPADAGDPNPGVEGRGESPAPTPEEG